MRAVRELRGPLLLGLVLALGSWAVISWVHAFADWLYGDARFYEYWGNLMTNYKVPYRDFNIEYPPGALPAFVVPVYLRKFSGYHGSYFDWLRVEILVLQAACLWATAVALLRLGVSRRHAWRALAVGGIGSGLLGPIAFFHYDWWPAFLAAAGLAALLAGRGVLACALAALGAAAKIFPALLIPFALVELWRRGRWRAVAFGAAAAVAVLAVVVAPFVALGPHGVSWALHRESRRPLEVESIGSSFFVAAHELGGYRLHTVWVAGSRNFAGPGPHATVRVLTVLTVLGLVAVFALWLRSRRGRDELVLGVTAAVAVYIVFSKVFSPQYLIWLLPLVPLVRGRAGARATGLLVAILGVTQVYEPYRQGEYWSFSHAWLDWLVVGRNVLVLALLAVLVEPLARGALARRRQTAPAVQPDRVEA